MTAEEYLAMDRAAEFRNEFLDGEIIAMSGGSARHSRIKSILSLKSGLRCGVPPARLSIQIFVFGYRLVCTRIRI